jgi:hypothetical protein
MALDRTWYNSLVDDDGSGLTGSVWDKADVDSLMDAIDAEFARIDGSLSMPFVHVRRNALQPAAPNTWTPIAFDVEVSDSHGMWSPGSPALVTIPQTGCYSLHGSITFELSASGCRFASFQVNGLQICPNILLNPTTGFVTIVHHQTIALLTAGQTLQFLAYQTSSGSLNTSDGGGDNSNQLRIRRLL